MTFRLQVFLLVMLVTVTAIAVVTTPATTVSGLCSAIQCSRFAIWQMPPPTPGWALPFSSSMPST